MKNPKVAVVSLNWNGAEHLENFLPTAVGLEYSDFIIVIVDNGSTDRSIKFIRENYPDVHIVSLKENLGYSKGFNKGIFYAIDLGVEYILITNNDVKLQKDILTCYSDNRSGAPKARSVGVLAGNRNPDYYFLDF